MVRVARGSEPVISQIESTVREQVPEWLGASARLAGPPSMQKRAWSYLIRFPLAAGEPPSRGVLVKVPRARGVRTLEEAVSTPHLRAEAREEFDTLRAVSSAFNRARAPHCATIRPLAYLDAWNAIVMEEVEAESLKEYLYRPVMLLNRERDWAPFEVALERAGQWLNVFHQEVGALRREPLDGEAIHREFGRNLRQLSYMLARPEMLAPVWEAVAAQAALFHGRMAPTAQLHGDFNCANILLTRCGRVLASDPNAGMRGPVYEELARLITDLWTRKRQVISYGRYIRAERLDRCRNAVLSGYFGEEAPDLPLLNLFCALAVVRKWLQNEREVIASPAPLRYPAGLFRPLMRRYFRDITLQFLPSP